MPKDIPAGAAAVFDAMPEDQRAGLLHLRARILDTAASIGVQVTETLRWGQPSYIAPKGSTVRLGCPKSGGFAIYAHCATTLIRDYSNQVPQARIEGQRAIHFDTIAEADAQPLHLLITAALTYHVRR